MTEAEPSVPGSEAQSVHRRWLLPDRIIITSSTATRSEDANPGLKPVRTKEGNFLGEIFAVTLEVRPGDQEASLDFIFKKNTEGDYQVLTSGWHSWSSSVAAGKYGDQLVGSQPIESSLGGRTTPFFEPGVGDEKVPSNKGRSYGWVSFRDLKTAEDVALGIIPSLDSMENIRYRQEEDRVIVTVTKNIQGVQNPVTFEVFIGQVNPRQETSSGKVKYVDLTRAFSRELSRLTASIPLMHDRVIGFSWPAYGSSITQEDIQREIKAGQGIVDTYIIDDGWEEASGSLTVNKAKFQDLSGLAREMKEAGITPGIWVSPFKVKPKGATRLPERWFMEDEHGRARKIRLPKPAGFFENSFELDVSVPEFREYLVERFVELARMGFEVFKVDFVSIPFTGKLQNTDKTAVEYYREVFQEIRNGIRERMGKEIELIGCGAPIMESIGLFNGIRITPDSALPNLGRFVSLLNRYTPLSNLITRINTGMYRDAMAVIARRALLFRGVHGLILDGIHIADKEVPLYGEKRDRLNKAILALNSLGIGNLFIGDSLDRVGEKGRIAWRNFIDQFHKTPLLERLRE